MKRNHIERTFAALTLSIFALALICSPLISNVKALTLPKSSMVALVPDANGLNSNGGALPTSPPGGFPNGDTFTFVNLHPNNIRDDATDPISAGGFDTVVIVMIDYFQNYWSNSTFRSRIENFVSGGGKLIIYDSEVTVNDFSGFIYPFTASTPGAYGASGPSWIVENNTLSHNDTAAASYVNVALLVNTDAAGDANAMTSSNPNWYVDIVAKNTLGVQGPVHTYAIYGNGLIIYNGLDIDYLSNSVTIGNANGQQVLGMIWYLELSGQTLPTSGSVPVSGLALTPESAINYIGSNHTVTARVTDALAEPVPGVDVDFEITSGINAGLSGSGVTDANGEATFTWSSSINGIDEVTASIGTAPGQIISTTATKTWIQEIDNVVPEVPLGTIAIAITMMFGFAVYYKKGGMRKPTTL